MMVVVQRNAGFTSKEHKEIQAQACCGLQRLVKQGAFRRR
jgi:hypothetical protein